jgi:hypothetical protein
MPLKPRYSTYNLTADERQRDRTSLGAYSFAKLHSPPVLLIAKFPQLRLVLLLQQCFALQKMRYLILKYIAKHLAA